MKYIASNIFLLFLIVAQSAFGQKAAKPQLMVYGSDFLAFSVAVQSAKSSVPTVWIVNSDELLPEFPNERVAMETLPHVDGGVWMEILMEMAQAPSPNDSVATAIKRNMNPRLFRNAVEKMLRQLPGLTVIRSEEISSMRKRRRDWEVQLSSKHKYNVRAVVDASSAQELDKLAGLSWDDNSEPIRPLNSLSLAQLRTSVATGPIDKKLYSILITDILAGEKEAFFNFRGVREVMDEDIRLTPFRAAVGQAVGATAAYLAFFKTSVERVDVRKLQTEIMTYGARILPFQDMAIQDRYFYAVQRFGLASVLSDLHQGTDFFFNKEEHVTFEEIEPVFDRLYSRSQLWFLDNKGEYFRWKDFLSLIKFVGLRGNEIDRRIADEWSTKLGLEGEFDEDAFVKRYQFAIVVDSYANPYVKAVNQQGEFIN